MKKYLIGLSLVIFPLIEKSYAAVTLDHLKNKDLIQDAKIVEMERNFDPATKILNLAPSTNDQVFNEVDVTGVETIIYDGVNFNASLKSFKGGKLYQRVTIYKSTLGGTLTVLDKNRTTSGNIDNLRNYSFIMQAGRYESSTFMKTPNGWNTIQQPLYYELQINTDDANIYYKDAYNVTHTIPYPASLSKVLDADNMMALENGNLYMKLPDVSTNTCQILADENDSIKDFDLYLAIDVGNLSTIRSVWDVTYSIRTATIARKYYGSAPTTTPLIPLENYEGYKIHCWY